MALAEARTLIERFAECIEGGAGLQFAGTRRRDLEAALARIAASEGFASESACLDWFLDGGWSQRKSALCALHLTVGETYFFREPRGLDLLVDYARGKLAADPGARLRFWSAGCCTGEEPYSMALALRQAVPGLDPARLDILGTDINAASLAQARAGVYRAWSFRGTDTALRGTHFAPTADGRYALRPPIRAMVQFAQLNLALPTYPSAATAGTDIIFCRNVLMYFSPRQAALAIARMRACLVNGGWLVVNPSEASAELFAGFRAVYHPDAIFFQKIAEAPVPAQRVAAPQPPTRARPTAAEAPADPAAAQRLARNLVRCGDAAGAQRCLERAASSWPLEARLYQTLAEIALEQGEYAAARRYLKRQLYLEPEAVVGCYLSALAHAGEGKAGAARRQFGACLALLAGLADEAIVPGSDGWRAAGLRARLRALLGETA